jgi:hypothetical protein
LIITDDHTMLILLARKMLIPTDLGFVKGDHFEQKAPTTITRAGLVSLPFEGGKKHGGSLLWLFQRLVIDTRI